MEIPIPSFGLPGAHGMKLDMSTRASQETAKPRNAVRWSCGFILNRRDNLNDLQLITLFVGSRTFDAVKNQGHRKLTAFSAEITH
jgi:hypothetical protein